MHSADAEKIPESASGAVTIGNISGAWKMTIFASTPRRPTTSRNTSRTAENTDISGSLTSMNGRHMSASRAHIHSPTENTVITDAWTHRSSSSESEISCDMSLSADIPKKTAGTRNSVLTSFFVRSPLILRKRFPLPRMIEESASPRIEAFSEQIPTAL